MPNFKKTNPEGQKGGKSPSQLQRFSAACEQSFVIGVFRSEGNFLTNFSLAILLLYFPLQITVFYQTCIRTEVMLSVCFYCCWFLTFFPWYWLFIWGWFYDNLMIHLLNFYVVNFLGHILWKRKIKNIFNWIFLVLLSSRYLFCLVTSFMLLKRNFPNKNTILWLLLYREDATAPCQALAEAKLRSKAPEWSNKYYIRLRWSFDLSCHRRLEKRGEIRSGWQGVWPPAPGLPQHTAFQTTSVVKTGWGAGGDGCVHPHALKTLWAPTAGMNSLQQTWECGRSNCKPWCWLRCLTEGGFSHEMRYTRWLQKLLPRKPE